LQTFESHLHPDIDLQSIYENFSENTISNFFIPFGLAPNFLINNKWHVLPMAIEESSVIAAASHAAKFWSAHGGFHAEVIDAVKIGQVHFTWTGTKNSLEDFFEKEKKKFSAALLPHIASMKNRGGGINQFYLKDLSDQVPNYYQLHVEFYTADAMGANFINTVLEEFAGIFSKALEKAILTNSLLGEFEIIMSILSNYTPDSLVKVWVECEVSAFDALSKNLSGKAFAEKFVLATNIAHADSYRATTHNKGVFNGIDGVVIATGNDFRAVEACGHSYAARDGKYRSLTKASVIENQFRLELEIPMSVGTVGGLTSGHPMAKTSLKILNKPSAEELMMIIATAGLASNFSALRSLITSGIQQGHMKMHLTNILRQLGVDDSRKQEAMEFFKDKNISYADVKKFVSETKP
nr:hydroxymethylglutaryl-CoA reductase, degradative [Bacteroidales bacterium]